MAGCLFMERIYLWCVSHRQPPLLRENTWQMGNTPSSTHGKYIEQYTREIQIHDRWEIHGAVHTGNTNTRQKENTRSGTHGKYRYTGDGKYTEQYTREIQIHSRWEIHGAVHTENTPPGWMGKRKYTIKSVGWEGRPVHVYV